MAALGRIPGENRLSRLKDSQYAFFGGVALPLPEL